MAQLLYGSFEGLGSMKYEKRLTIRSRFINYCELFRNLSYHLNFYQFWTKVSFHGPSKWNRIKKSFGPLHGNFFEKKIPFMDMKTHAC